MAAKKTTKKKFGGPFLASAVFCESIIDDTENKTVSAIQIIDGCQITIQGNAPPDYPSKQKPVGINQKLLLMFRTGDAGGSHVLKLIMELPNGKRRKVLEQPVAFTEAPHGGATIKTEVKIAIADPGLFWMDVYLDGKRKTRVPLNITITRVPTPSVEDSKKPETPKLKKA